MGICFSSISPYGVRKQVSDMSESVIILDLLSQDKGGDVFFKIQTQSSLSKKIQISKF